MPRLLSVAGALVLAIAVRGGGSASPANADSTTVSAVGRAEKGAVCDWFVATVGGYGAAATCGRAAFLAPPDRATCVADFPACDVTVAVLRDCLQRMVLAQNTCTQAAEAAAAGSASCQAVGAAGCFD